MITLVYVSSATERLAEEDLVEILRVSRKNNNALGVTGMLLYKDGNFMQALEGPEKSVDGLEMKIRRDPRHHQFLRLLRKPIEERSFSEWSMGFRNLDDLPEDAADAHTDFLRRPLNDEKFIDNPSQAMKLLRTFKEGMR